MSAIRSIRIMITAAAFAIALSPLAAMAQTSSMFHRAERGQFGSNQPAAVAPPQDTAATPAAPAPSPAPAAANANAAAAATPAPQPSAGSGSDGSCGAVISKANSLQVVAPGDTPANGTATPPTSPLGDAHAEGKLANPVVQATSLANPAAPTMRADPTKPDGPKPYVMGDKTGERLGSPAMAALNRVSFTASAPPEPKHFQAHDLVTIIVREETSFASDGKTDLDKKASANAKIESWLKGTWSTLPLKAVPVDTPPELKAEAERKIENEGKVNRKDSFIGRLTAEVVDVKPNGTLVVVARKFIKTDEEEQNFELSGTCRVTDITADNTVLSTQLADLTVRKTHAGAVNDTTKRGAIPWVADKVNPW